MGEEFLKELLGKAYSIGNDAEFKVEMNSDEGFYYKTMTYIELGTFLITNASRIEQISISLKRD